MIYFSVLLLARGNKNVGKCSQNYSLSSPCTQHPRCYSTCTFLQLNSGAQATVHRVVHKSDGQEYAVKVISRLNLTSTASGAVLYEVLLQSSLSCHPNVVSLTDFFEESDNYYLVMELMRGGDLFDRIAQREKYTELEARRLCRDLLRAVGYCHKNGVAHCDLKPKNMMLAVSLCQAPLI